MEAISRIKGTNILCEKWLQILDEINIGAFMVDVERKVAAMNQNAQALMGLREAEATGKDCREVFVGVPCLANCLFRRPEDRITHEPMVQFTNEMDEKHLVTRMAAPVFDTSRNVVGCLTILQDQKPMADLINRIHYEERSMKMLLDNLDIGVFTINLGGYITFFNKEAENISGYDRRQVLGEPCSAFFKREAAQDLCLLKETVATGRARTSRQGQILTKDGEVIPIRAHYMALRNEKGTIIGGLATFQDLTLVQQLNQAIQDRYTFNDMIAKSPAMRKIFEMVRVVAGTDATVLIEGATGTGKELLARAIHSASNRGEAPLIKVNCAAIPDNLLESEMFGYVKGAFTGADHDKPGLFQAAHGGTIFLDEIGDLPIPLQAKLLRVLEDREFYPLGSRSTVKVNVRILAATNRQIDQLVNKKLFREDLFYRLNVFRIELPELKDRRIDLPLLIRHILRRLCVAHDNHLIGISQDAMKRLLNYDYPGNVRELENILEYALIVCQDDIIRPRDLPEYIDRRQQTRPLKAPRAILEPVAMNNPESQKILQALRENDWHRLRTARSLGIDRATLWRKIKKYGILP